MPDLPLSYDSDVESAAKLKVYGLHSHDTDEIIKRIGPQVMVVYNWRIWIFLVITARSGAEEVQMLLDFAFSTPSSIDTVWSCILIVPSRSRQSSLQANFRVWPRLCRTGLHAPSWRQRICRRCVSFERLRCKPRNVTVGIMIADLLWRLPVLRSNMRNHSEPKQMLTTTS